MKVQLLSLMLLVCASLMGKHAPQIEFIEVENSEQWQAVFEKAKAENKLVFVDAYTDWCTYCHKLDKEVYTDPSIIDYYSQHFVNVKFDAESEFGYPKAQQLSITGYPTLLFMTASNQVFKVIDSFVPAETLLAYGMDISHMIEVLPELEAKFEVGSITMDEQLEFISILEGTDENKAKSIAKNYVEKLKEEDFLAIENIWLLSRHQNQLDGYPFMYISSHKELMNDTHGTNEINDYMSAVYNDNLQLAIKYGDDQLLDKVIKKVLPEIVDNDQLPTARYSTKSVYYAQRSEFDKYKMEVNAYMNNHLSRDSKADFALSTTYDIIENYASDEMILFATQLLQQALEINEKNFELNSIFGYTKGLMGDYKAADKHLKIAKTLANGEEEMEIIQSLLDAVEMMKK